MAFSNKALIAAAAASQKADALRAELVAEGVLHTVATSYTVALASSTGIVGTAVNLTATPVGGGWPAGETLSPALGGIAGTFSPQTASPAAGSTTPATFALTPGAAGTGTVTVTASPSMGTPAGVQITVSAAAPAPLPAITTTTSGATFVAGAAAGTVVATLSAPPFGATRTLLPGDGRLVLNNAGTAIVVGMTAASAGTISATVKDSKSGNADSPVLTVPVTVTAAQSAPTPSPTPAPVSTTPTTLSNFAGAAGTQPTGASAIAFRVNPITSSALDGNGNYVLGPNSGFAQFEARGPVKDGAYTVTLTAPGQVGFQFRATAGAAMAGYFLTANGGGNVFLGTVVNGAYERTVLDTSVPYPTGTQFTLILVGSKLSLFVDNKGVYAFTDTEFAADGILGIGLVGSKTSAVSIASVVYQTPTQYDAAYAAAHPTITPITYTPNLSGVSLLDMTISGTNPASTPTSGQHVLRYADAAAWGEVPAGYKIKVTRQSDSAVLPTSFHSLSFRTDGSLEKFEMLLDEAGPALAAYGGTAVAAAGAIQHYRLQAVAGSMANTPTVPDTNFTSHDLKLRFKPYNDGSSDIYWLSLNTIMAGAKGPPAVNSNPRSRWDDVNSTTLMREVRAEGFFSTDGTPAGTHRWLSAVLYVTSLADGSMLVDTVAKYTNTHGPLSGAGKGGTTAPRHIDGEFALFDGATLLKSWGGLQDYRTIPCTFLTNKVVLPIGHAFGTVSPEQYRDYGTETGFVPFHFSSTGSLPPGISPSQTFYLGFDGSRQGGSSTPYVTHNERGTPGYFYYPWAASTPYNPGDVRQTGTAVFRCVTGGTSGGTAPTGYSASIADGSVVWESLCPDTSGGSGTFSIYPVVTLCNKATVQLLDDDANPVQIGTRRTVLMAGHDRDHLVNKSWLTPPYDPTSATLPDTAPVPPYSINTYDYKTDLNDYGDNPGDKRIGMINNTAAWGLQQGTDRALYRRTVLEAVMFASYPTQYDDERSMGQVMALLGPDYTTNTNFPGLPASNPTFLTVTNGTYGAPGWAADLLASALGVEFGYRYQETSDGSHYPVPSYGAYLRTGRTMNLDQLAAQANALMMCTEYGANNPVIRGRTFSRPQTSFLRQTGWSWKGWNQCEMMLPDSDARKPVWQRQMRDQGDFFLAHISELPTGMRQLGLWSSYIEEGSQCSAGFMPYFCIIAFSMVIGRGRYPAWGQAAGAHIFGFHFDLLDERSGGSGFFLGAEWYRDFPDGDTTDQGIKFRYPSGNRYFGSDLPFMADMTTVLRYNFPGFQTYPSTGILGDYGTGAALAQFGQWPYGTTSFQIGWICALGIAAQAVNAMVARGEPVGSKLSRAPRLFAEVNSRVQGYGGVVWGAASSNYFAGGFNGCYPAFSATPTQPYALPAAATVLPGAVKNLAISYTAIDAFGITYDLPDNAGAASRFMVEVSTDGGGSWTVVAASTPQTAVRVASTTTAPRSQQARVTAINEVGSGSVSPPLPVTLLASGPASTPTPTPSPTPTPTPTPAPSSTGWVIGNGSYNPHSATINVSGGPAAPNGNGVQIHSSTGAADPASAHIAYGSSSTVHPVNGQAGGEYGINNNDSKPLARTGGSNYPDLWTINGAIYIWPNGHPAGTTRTLYIWVEVVEGSGNWFVMLNPDSSPFTFTVTY